MVAPTKAWMFLFKSPDYSVTVSEDAFQAMDQT
jgi:hypothetical protein